MATVVRWMVDNDGHPAVRTDGGRRWSEVHAARDFYWISGVVVGGGLKMEQIGRFELVEGFAVLALAMMSPLGRARSAVESTRSDLDLVF